jgi:hypothetical protein
VKFILVVHYFFCIRGLGFKEVVEIKVIIFLVGDFFIAICILVALSTQSDLFGVLMCYDHAISEAS